MGSVSSLIPGAKHCKGSDQKQRKAFPCKRGGLLRHGFTHDHKNNNDSKLGHDPAGTGHSDDFFYIKVSHTPRDDTQNAASSRNTQTDLSSRFEKTTDTSFLPPVPESSSSSVETHNSLSTILGTDLSRIDRSRNRTPEPNHDMSSGSPCDSGISGSSWTNEGANSRTKWTDKVNRDGRASNSSTRSASVLSDCTSGPASLKTDTMARNVELNRTSLSCDKNFPSSLETEASEERQLSSSEVPLHALQAQQLLQLQVLQLQQDKDRLQEEVEQLIRDRDATESQIIYKHQHMSITPTLEETQWEVCQKAGEISLLKQQLKDAQAEVTGKLSEIVSLRAALRETRSKMEELEEKHQGCEETLRLRSTEIEVCENELQRKKNEAELLREKVGKLETNVKSLKQDLLMAKEEHLELLSLKVQLQEQQHLLQIYESKMAEQEPSGAMDVLRKEVERLSEQLENEKEKKEKILSSFQHEKQTWNKEKDRVIRYQKQLQINYMQMHRKNQELETKLKEENRKVENRTDKDRDGTLEDTDLRKNRRLLP
ncbi:NEDD4-binding protein 3 [Bagarius yarrelli]|uniref:NEDD4-binding protein 3 n=1 Tax=Bagarius yarrelli TaxID=175774 RepID=A0A556VX39_BAGYA|nr:NEDD4-binding protein 3 [Bagarius yarrelli]